MKKMMLFAVTIAAGALLFTGCSTCCQKDAACSKSASLACTNGFSAVLAACPGSCTNKVNAVFVACPKDSTNKFTLAPGAFAPQWNVVACPGSCTNKVSGAKS